MKSWGKPFPVSMQEAEAYNNGESVKGTVSVLLCSLACAGPEGWHFHQEDSVLTVSLPGPLLYQDGDSGFHLIN